VAEALRTKSVYWAERNNDDEPLHFRQYLELEKGEKVVLVDDIFRTGAKLAEMKALVEKSGGEVVAMAVIVFQPSPEAATFGELPFYSLVQLDHTIINAKDCAACKQGVPIEKVWV
jgi:orotate phosphoribosyltransferase